eukprot:GHUV01045103.1.p2 GENE.GHUV01045103.1~~GHUV01045103.1.p2  ORF type:complete len:102 (-),score=4.79 GHUV01045103.1:126-431(-)
MTIYLPRHHHASVCVCMQTDRSKTPWLIVASHAPWYNSYAGHYKEADCFRMAYVLLLVKHQVDVFIHGHVHSYERTKPVVDFQVGVEGGGPRPQCVLKRQV